MTNFARSGGLRDTGADLHRNVSMTVLVCYLLALASTWHQWHAAWPKLISRGPLSRWASAIASGPHCHRSTGFEACWSRYGLLDAASRFAMATLSITGPEAANARPATARGRAAR